MLLIKIKIKLIMQTSTKTQKLELNDIDGQDKKNREDKIMMRVRCEASQIFVIWINWNGLL